jgi:hypothetical protein
MFTRMVWGLKMPRHVVSIEDNRLDEYLEDYAIPICRSTGQGSVEWYPGSKHERKFVFSDWSDDKEYRYATLAAAIEAYNNGPRPTRELDENRDVHTEHCCKTCGCKYGDDVPRDGNDETDVGCSVVSGHRKQSYPCSGECNNW